MAELHIERKERSVWPWVIGVAILLALLLWFLFGRDQGDGIATGTAAVDSVPVATATPATAAGELALPAAVSEFVRFSETPPASASPSHEYTAEGLRRLADALGAVAQGVTVSGVDIQERLSAIRTRADAMQREPTSGQHSLQAREALLLASGVLSQIQEARFATLASAVGEVNSAATAVQADRSLLDQTTAVQRFFERASQAVQEMARGA